MNKFFAIGRLTADPELVSVGADNVSLVDFCLAIDRRSNKESDPDFIDCTAWKGTAEFICKYFSKGSKMAIVGTLHTHSFQDKNGNNRKGYSVTVDEVEFASAKKETETNVDMPPIPRVSISSSQNSPQDDEDELPLPMVSTFTSDTSPAICS